MKNLSVAAENLGGVADYQPGLGYMSWTGNEYILTSGHSGEARSWQLSVDQVPEEPHSQSLGDLISQTESSVLQLQERWMDF